MSSAEVNINFFDTTARDGAQSLPMCNQFPDGSKPDITRAIADFGVDVIEAGFPRTPTDGKEVAVVANTVGQTAAEVYRWRNGEPNGTIDKIPVIAGLSRVVPADIEATWGAVKDAVNPRIHTFVSTDDAHREAKFPGISQEGLSMMARLAINYAIEISSEHPNASVEFSAEAASTTDDKYLEQIVRMAVGEGADVINVPDTVGQRGPFWMYDFYSRVIDWATDENNNVVVSAHNHNDMGNATANSYALIKAAVDTARANNRPVNIQMETTICGLGERAGNADIFPVVANVFKGTASEEVPVNWSINPAKAVWVARYVMAQAGLEVDRQNPVVGSDILAHRSGIHSDGVIKGGHGIYTPFDPQFWGHDTSARHEEGKYQGKAGRQAAIHAHALAQ